MKNLLFLLILAAVVPCRAEVFLSNIFRSNMVLQQQSKVHLWGWAGPLEKFTVTTSWDQKTYEVVGDHDASWWLPITTPAAGGPYNIRITGPGNTILLDNILIGEVWLCAGQSNMEWSAANGALDAKAELPTCRNERIRFFRMIKQIADTPQNEFKNGQSDWRLCDSASLFRFSAVGYFFGKKLHENLGQTPVGLIDISWGGSYIESWIPSEALNGRLDLRQSGQKIPDVPWCPDKSSVIYNAMAAPLNWFPVAGVIWYQGESNRHQPQTYYDLMHALVSSWRSLRNKPDLPFYYVQIAPYTYNDEASGRAAAVREMQAKAMDIAHSGMVVVTDQVDNIKDIHPAYKKEVGIRLANWALATHYGKESGPYRCPQYKSMRLEGNRVLLSFDNAEKGLMAKGKDIKEFEIAGADQRFYPAKARITASNEIEVWSDEVNRPSAVRFAFSDAPQPNLFSTEGLPVVPFRTDDWKLGYETVK